LHTREAISNVKQVGVVCGADESEMARAVNNLFISGLSRMKSCRDVENSSKVSMASENEEESIKEIENLAVRQLCGELAEELFDDELMTAIN
jgi:hypothetical protein